MQICDFSGVAARFNNIEFLISQTDMGPHGKNTMLKFQISHVKTNKTKKNRNKTGCSNYFIQSEYSLIYWSSTIVKAANHFNKKNVASGTA